MSTYEMTEITERNDLALRKLVPQCMAYSRNRLIYRLNSSHDLTFDIW